VQGSFFVPPEPFSVKGSRSGEESRSGGRNAHCGACLAWHRADWHGVERVSF